MKSIWTLVLFGVLTIPAIWDRSIVPCEDSGDPDAPTCTIDDPSAAS